jgi:hypothetical protein
MMRLFNPVWLVLLVAIVVLFLAACDNKKEFYKTVDADDITAIDAMNGANDWSRFFVDLYPPVVACANHHTSQPAIIVDATPMNKGRAMAVIQGDDKSIFECVIETGNDEPETWVKSTNTEFRGPIFRPEGAGLPLPDSCLNNIPVKTNKNAPVGWISYRKSNCGGE